MDEKLLTPLAVLTGVIVTSIVNLITKLIDNNQKETDHKLAIRSAIVIKKIEASQSYVGTTNLKINNLLISKQYFENLLLHNESIEEIRIRLNSSITAIDALHSSKDNFITLYYDTTSFIDDIGLLTDRVNNIVVELSNTIKIPEKGKAELTVVNRSKIADYISEVSLLITSYKTLVSFIRENLNSYDVLNKQKR